MRFHIYKSAWTPCVGDELDALMESSNLMDAVAVVPEGKNKLLVIFPMESLSKLQRQYFIF